MTRSSKGSERISDRAWNDGNFRKQRWLSQTGKP